MAPPVSLLRLNVKIREASIAENGYKRGKRFDFTEMVVTITSNSSRIELTAKEPRASTKYCPKVVTRYCS